MNMKEIEKEAKRGRYNVSEEMREGGERQTDRKRDRKE